MTKQLGWKEFRIHDNQGVSEQPAVKYSNWHIVLFSAIQYTLWWADGICFTIAIFVNNKTSSIYFPSDELTCEERL